MARSFLGGEFAGGESAWWRGNWILVGQVDSILMQQDSWIYNE